MSAEDGCHYPHPLAETCPGCEAPAGDAPLSIERSDRYTIVMGGHSIPATVEQESRIRALDAEQQARFLKIMGRR